MTTENPALICCLCDESVVLSSVVIRQRHPKEPEAQWLSEQLDELSGRLTALGWVLHKNEKGYRKILCPACAQKIACPHCTKESPRPDLPPYDPRMNCPACGHRKLDTRFCDGRTVARCVAGFVMHLHRTCQRCGFTFVQGTKPPKEPKTKEQPSDQPRGPDDPTEPDDRPPVRDHPCAFAPADDALVAA